MNKPIFLFLIYILKVACSVKTKPQKVIQKDYSAIKDSLTAQIEKRNRQLSILGDVV